MYPKYSFKTLGAYLFQTHLKGVVVVVNKPSRISPFYHLLVKDNKGGGLRGGALINSLPLRRGRGY